MGENARQARCSSPARQQGEEKTFYEKSFLIMMIIFSPRRRFLSLQEYIRLKPQGIHSRHALTFALNFPS